MNVKLVVVGGEAKAAEINLKLPAVIGRGRNATLMLPHPLVSRQHCELFEANGQLVVRDLGSLNGTFVGKQRVTEGLLPPGELLTIGTVTFRAIYEQQPDQQPPRVAMPQSPALAASRSPNDQESGTLPPPDPPPVPQMAVPMADTPKSDPPPLIQTTQSDPQPPIPGEVDEDSTDFPPEQAHPVEVEEVDLEDFDVEEGDVDEHGQVDVDEVDEAEVEAAEVEAAEVEVEEEEEVDFEMEPSEVDKSGSDGQPTDDSSKQGELVVDPGPSPEMPAESKSDKPDKSNRWRQAPKDDSNNESRPNNANNEPQSDKDGDDDQLSSFLKGFK